MYHQTTDRMLSFDIHFKYNMQQRVEINSFLATKLKDDCIFSKYDIEAAIDEVESEENHVKLKYKFVLLSNPTNVKISIDGFTTIYGNQQEMAKQLGNDEKNIPHVINSLYQEIFPFLFITSKTMQIPCPAYKLADIAKTNQREPTPLLEQIEEKHAESGTHEDVELTNDLTEVDIETETPESIIQEQKIHTV